MRIAIVGTGSVGFRHLNITNTIEGIYPIAVPQRQSRAVELQSMGFQAATDLHTAVDLGVNAAIVATDTSRHVKDCKLALHSGLDVLVEKPIATDSYEALGLVTLAKNLNRRLYVACVLRFSESLNKFRDRIHEIGRIHSVKVACGSYLPDWRPNRPYTDSYSARQNEGGVLRDLIHEIDYTGWLFGWPEKLSASVRNISRLNIDCDEIANLMWDTPDGCHISIDLDYLTQPTRRYVIAYGEKGILKWDGIDQTVSFTEPNGTVENINTKQTIDQLFEAQARAFINSMKGTIDLKMASGMEGMKALAVCDAARRSSKSRMEEAVDYLC